MNKPAYMDEPWFELLQARVQIASRTNVARSLGLTLSAVSQVLNAGGLYGTGQASTKRVAERVVHTFGRYPCMHLSAESGGEEVIVTAEECRHFAHRAPPTASPREMQHWQTCHQCPHKAASAPPLPREPRPRAASLKGAE